MSNNIEGVSIDIVNEKWEHLFIEEGVDKIWKKNDSLVLLCEL